MCHVEDRQGRWIGWDGLPIKQLTSITTVHRSKRTPYHARKCPADGISCHWLLPKYVYLNLSFPSLSITGADSSYLPYIQPMNPAHTYGQEINATWHSPPHACARACTHLHTKTFTERDAHMLHTHTHTSGWTTGLYDGHLPHHIPGC